MKYFILALFLVVPGLAAQELKIATIAPDGSSWMNELRLAAEEIHKKSGQQVRVRFFPGGVMGDASAVLRRMRLGQLQGGAFTLGDLAPVADAVNLYSLPFMFDNEAQVQALRPTFDPLILAALEEGGIIAPGLSLGGFAYLFSREPFPDPDRLTTNWRVWVPASDPLSRRTLEQAGVSPVPLALAEVYTSLQTGVINTFATTPSGAIILQWHSRARHMLDLPVLMTVGTIGLDQRAFGRLAPENQEIVLTAFASALERLENSNREENIRARSAIEGQGITIAQPTAEQQTAWRSIAGQTRHAMVRNEQIRIPHLERLERELESVRESP